MNAHLSFLFAIHRTPEELRQFWIGTGWAFIGWVLLTLFSLWRSRRHKK